MPYNWYTDTDQWVDTEMQWKPMGTIADSEVYVTITGSKPKAICSGAKAYANIKARDAKILMSGF